MYEPVPIGFDMGFLQDGEEGGIAFALRCECYLEDFGVSCFALRRKKIHRIRCVDTTFSKQASGPSWVWIITDLLRKVRRTTVVVPPQMADLVPVVVSLNASGGGKMWVKRVPVS